jgi:CRP-like cAMP-binding protein
MRYYARKIKKFQAGEMVFSENSECDGMYIIDKGKVRVFKTLSMNGEEKQVELCQLGPKAMFGEMAMIDENRRSASVQAVMPTECTIITKQIFEDQLTHIPPWMVNLIRILVQRLRDTNDKLRRHIEDRTQAPNDDTGSMIMVSADKAIRPSAADLRTPAGPESRKRADVHPDEIIKDLFEGN